MRPLSVLASGISDVEFPLSVFYEALRRRVAPAVEATRGITGEST